jgi:large subunit ribosomal protein L1
MPSKRFKKLPEKTSDLPAEAIEKLIPEVKKNCTTKFDESVDLSFQINNKQKKSEVNIRTVVNLPGGTGKKVKVAVVCEDAKAEEAKNAGADIVGSDEFIEKIKGGEMDFEKLICTPSMMIKLSKLGKVLGPKGLMPNPKLGSVTDDLKTAISDAKSGQAEIRNDKDGNIGVSIGKKSFNDDQLIKNYNAVLDALEKEKSNNTVKGDLVKAAFITSSMGVSYKLKLGKNILIVMMNKEQKKNYISEMTEKFENSKAVMVTHYQGLTMPQLDELRSQMRDHGIIFRITKNRITKLALEKTKCKDLSNLFIGPTAVAFGEDAIMSARILSKFAKENENLKLIGGIMDNEVLDQAGVQNVANLPTLNEARANIVGILSASAGKLISILLARSEKMSSLSPENSETQPKE